MRIFLRGLTMTAVVLSASASYAVAQNPGTFVGDSESEYYGEEYATETPAQQTSDEEGSILQASAVAHVGDEPAVPARGGVRSASMNANAPTPYHATGLRKIHASHVAASSSISSCDGSCDGACDGGCKTRSRMTRMMSGKCPDLWLQAETLLWFPQARTSVPLVALNAPGENALLTEPGTTVVGSEAGNNLSPGLRLDFGKYFGDGNFGIGGRFWMLSEDDDSYSLSGDGTTQTIARPYFDTFLGRENAVRIASEQGGNDDFTGTVSGQESLQVIAAEAYGRLNLGRGREYHTDLIGGYSYFSIDNDLSIRSTSIDNENGGVTTFRDSFDVTNDFHGGQIGAETILSRGRWVARSLTKVHLGNMSQQVTVDGDATVQATNVSPVLPFGDGLLAGGRNGVFEQDVFTFAPELNLKLGYRFREHVTFTVGYSFIYWNNVALAGQQIDRNFEFDVNNGVVRPGQQPFGIRNAGYWVQGIDLGTTIEF